MTPSGSRWNLPNVITVVRIAFTPAIAWTAMIGTVSAGLLAWVLFVLAALSDLWDGYLARKHGWITDLGKLLDPVADKLLLASTFIPFWFLSRRPGGEIPYWGELPLWILLVIFGREIVVTVFRGWAARRGVVISAGTSGKYKAFLQNLFSGGLLLWYPVIQTARERGWSGGFWSFWEWLHSGWLLVTLAVALFLTVYSMLDYFWSYRSLVVQRSD